MATGAFWYYGLCTWTVVTMDITGIQKMSFNTVSDTQPAPPGGTLERLTQDTDRLDSLHTIVNDAIREGLKRASPPMWFLLPTDQFHKLQTIITPVVPEREI